MSQFVHLHVHTQYSILDGAASVKGLVARAKELGMPAVAISDHGSMFGVKEFHEAATKAGIKPIIGCEVYVVQNHLEKDKDERAGDHLLLLAKNLHGYHNLIKLVSYSWTEGFYYKPRIDKRLLEEYREGLVCASACLGGELPKVISRGNRAQASELIEDYKRLFGDDYYLELQLFPSNDPKIREELSDRQAEVNRVLLELSAEHGVKCIATNDVHFMNADDAQAHDRLICLNMGKDLDDPDRMRFSGEEYFKTFEEMAELFGENPEILANTLEVAGKIEAYSLDREPLMPNFPIPGSFGMDIPKLRDSFFRSMKIDDPGDSVSLEDFAAGNPLYEDKLIIARQFQYLEHLAFDGAKERYGDPLPEAITERLDYELRTIEWMGYPGYFLIIWDLIRAAREMGVSVGPGRGSAAGSVVAYCLKITNIDPIEYNLLFERFLNPDRISLPDVDIDFDEEGRADVLNYVVGKYGQKRVAQIITFGTMAPKMAIRDVARVQKLSLQESDRLAKLIPERPGTSFREAYREVPELLAEKKSGSDLVRKTLEYAEKLEGSIRQTGVHACGVIIGRDDLELFVPMAVAKDADLNVVQFEGKQVESVGLIKMDFLGLKTLSIIKDALDNIREVHNTDIDIDNIPLDDKPTYELYSRGETTGLFQFESPGMRKHLKNLKPSRFDDLIAMNALYRPGPMEYIPNFIARKHGKEKVVYELPDMEEYLSDTYGVTVYQEQVMLLSQKLAGFTGGEADTLRKAMGKKQRAVLDKMKPKFIEGALSKGRDSKICEKIWTDWEAFASYAFNKSHSTCYAYISYQTAYLKAHYPPEFMAALLSRNASDIRKITFFMDECKRMGIPVLGPDINASSNRFVSDIEGNIRFGLTAIKGVGEGAVEAMIEERRANGRFTSIYDFVERVNLQVVNKKTIENLAAGGALDSLTGFNRSKFFAADPKEPDTAFTDQLIRYGNRVKSDRNNLQQSLFGDDISSGTGVQRPEPPQADVWSKLEMLNREHEVIGIYLSAHPLDEYGAIVKHYCTLNLADLENLNSLGKRDFVAAGMVTSVKLLTSKKSGKNYGRFTLEDYSGQYEFTLFGKDFENFRRFLFDDYYLLLRGKIVPKLYNEKELEVRISSIVQLPEVADSIIKEMSLTIPLDGLNEQVVDEISTVVRANRGAILLRIRVVDTKSGVSAGFISKSLRVGPTQELFDTFDRYGFKYALL